MADEQTVAEGGGSAGPPPKCPECKKGLPAWMATFSDMVTLLLTFFVLLLSFAKTETAKYEAALGSLRNAFGGNVLNKGEVLQLGKSPDDAPTMLEAQESAKPFPIDFLTMEGLLDKHEINRSSDETLTEMRAALKQYGLSNSVHVYEMAEGIKAKIKDKIYFRDGSLEISHITIEVFERMVKLLSENDWSVFVEGHAAQGETSQNGEWDSLDLSMERAKAVTRSLIKRGVRPHKITPIGYGDSRPDVMPGDSSARSAKDDRRVEFLIRKRDLRTSGHQVSPH